jgi:hypothetical protein
MGENLIKQKSKNLKVAINYHMQNNDQSNSKSEDYDIVYP